VSQFRQKATAPLQTEQRERLDRLPAAKLDVGAVKAIAVFSAMSGLTVDEFAVRARLLEAL